MKKNSVIVILLAGFLAVVSGSGCGNSSDLDKKTEDKGTVVVKETAEKEVEEATEKTAKADTVTGSKQTEKIQEIKSTSTVKSSSRQENKAEFKATFIELGSVRCVPCRMMQPIMDEIEEEYPEQVKVVFYDVWTAEGQPYGKEYGIRVIPTQVFLDKDGNEYYRHEGYFPKEELVEILKMQGVE